jgi:hypothetical protein
MYPGFITFDVVSAKASAAGNEVNAKITANKAAMIFAKRLPVLYFLPVSRKNFMFCISFVFVSFQTLFL